MAGTAKTYRRILAISILLFCCRLSPAQAPGATNPKAIFERGQAALNRGDYGAAERDFRRLIQTGTRTAPVYTNLGVVYLRTGRLDSAVKVLTQAGQLAPRMEGIHLNLGLAYFQQREFAKAAIQFDSVISASPANIQARYLGGTCHFMTDHFSGAVADFEPILNQESQDLEYLYMLGISYGMQKRFDDSNGMFQRLVTAGGETPHLHLLLGKAYFALGQNEKAEYEFQEATSGKALPYAHYYLGVLYQKLGRIDDAAIQFEHEINIAPDNPWAYRDLSEIDLDRADPVAAIALLKKGTRNNPNAPELFDVLGRTYMRTKDFAKAIVALKQATSLDTRNGTYHAQLSRALLAAGQRYQADTEMARASALMTQRPSQGSMEKLSRDRSRIASAGDK